MPVLLETSRRDERSHLAGWTDNYLRVELGEGEAESGVEDVRIVSLRGDQLLGERITKTT